MDKVFLSKEDYQRYLRRTEEFVRNNPTLDTKVRAFVQPSDKIPKGVGFINGREFKVK